MPSSNTLDLAEIRMIASYEDGPYPILTIVGMYDLSLHIHLFSEILLHREVIEPLGVNASSAGSKPENVNSRSHI